MEELILCIAQKAGQYGNILPSSSVVVFKGFGPLLTFLQNEKSMGTLSFVLFKILDQTRG